MVSAERGFRGCYLHPDRPAVRNCASCGRPVCLRCLKQGGDPLLCRPCSLKKDSGKEGRESGIYTPPPPPRRETPPLVSELTVLDNGRVIPPVTPRSEEGPQEPALVEDLEASRRKAEPGSVRRKAEGEPGEPSVRGSVATSPMNMRRKAKEEPGEPVPRGAEPGKEPPVFSRTLPAHGSASEKKRREASSRGTSPSPRGAEPGKEPPSPETRPVRLTGGARERMEKVTEQEEAGQTAPPGEKPWLKPTGVPKQLLGALPYAVGGGLLVAGLWLMLALINKQWSQVSAFTVGIVIPWSMYKGSTRRKRSGRPVWTEAPPPVWMSLISGPLAVSIILLMEYLAYEILYRTNPRVPFREFIQLFFRWTDWLLAACGVALAFLVPFLLSYGDRWGAPSSTRKREPSGGRFGDSAADAAKDTPAKGPPKPPVSPKR